MSVTTYEWYVIAVTVYLIDCGYDCNLADRCVEDVTSDSRKPKSVLSRRKCILSSMEACEVL